MKKDANACLICGAPLVYLPEAKPMECAGCGRTFTSNACHNLRKCIVDFFCPLI